MAISLTTQRAPAWLRELAVAQADYTELFGWPVSMRVGARNLVIAIGTVLDAVSMPAGLGARVRQELGIAMLSGPVFTDPDGQRWTFLTKLVTAIRPGVADQLSTLRVSLPAHGSFIAIPASVAICTGATWRWIERPARTRALPPAYAVIATARRLGDGAVLAETA